MFSMTPAVLSIGTWLTGIGLQEPIEQCPAWPPDLFALTGTLIRRSGAYLRVFEDRDPGSSPTEIGTAARQWRERLDAITVAAEDIKPSDLQSARTPVLTLTGLGMAERSRPILAGQRAPASRVIALWRDAIQGEIQIALDLPDHDACVLSLEYDKRTEYSADGRSDHGETCYPVYAGYRSFKT